MVDFFVCEMTVPEEFTLFCKIFTPGSMFDVIKLKLFGLRILTHPCNLAT